MLNLGSTTRLFEDQDFGDAIKDDEEELFLVPGAKNVTKLTALNIEDNTEILR